MDKRYQVFVSSTYRDLQGERQAVLNAIQSLHHIPVGMELFPASDSEPWELIESIISDSDYYVIIIGGRYGSMDEAGVSYTEREFDLAEKLGKPILAFLHAEPDSLPMHSNETVKKVRRKLEQFRKRVEKHHCKYWKETNELKSQVTIALVWAFTSHPAIGWVRADGVNNTELLQRLADLQQKYDLLFEDARRLRENADLDIASEQFAQGEETVEIGFSTLDESEKEILFDKPTHTIQLSWDEIFFGIGMMLAVGARHSDIRVALSPVIAGAFLGTEEGNKLVRTFDVEAIKVQSYVSDASLLQILRQFAALGFVEPDMITSTQQTQFGPLIHFTDIHDVWRLTPKGRKKYFRAIAIPRCTPPPPEKNE